MRGDPLSASPFVAGDDGLMLSFEKEAIASFREGRDLMFVADMSLKRSGLYTDFNLLIRAVVSSVPQDIRDAGFKVRDHRTNEHRDYVNYCIEVADLKEVHRLCDGEAISRRGLSLIWLGYAGCEILRNRLDGEQLPDITVIAGGKTLRCPRRPVQALVGEGW